MYKKILYVYDGVKHGQIQFGTTIESDAEAKALILIAYIRHEPKRGLKFALTTQNQTVNHNSHMLDS